MAAGQGFKTFNTGEVLTAADTNGYLMQGVNVFADAAARTAAITSPQEGQMSYLKSTDSIESYNGSAWVTVGPAINPNLVINGNFTINQRLYVSGANLTSGSYGFDRWKSNFTNTTLTFTSAPAGQSVTINSGGGLQQIVEQANVPAGTYTLSFSGTATARIYNSGATPPSYAASPIIFTADGLANVVVEFTASGSTKTLSKVKLELGSSATAFSYAGQTIQGELAACQRYFWRHNNDAVSAANYAFGGAYSSTQAFGYTRTPVTMRIAPTVTFQAASNYSNSSASGSNLANTVISASGGQTNGFSIYTTVSSGLAAGDATAFTFAGANNYYEASAEL